MAQAASLQDFLAWGMRTLPARHTVVVVGGHGGGFLGVVEDTERRHLMPLSDLVGAMQRAGVHADVLALNACLMAGAEVACEVAPQSDWLVASQAVEEREGMPLGALLERLGPETTPAEAAAALVEVSAATPERTSTLSALDCSRIGALEDALDGLGEAILAHTEARDALRAHIAALPSFYGQRPWDRPLSEMRDAQAFASRLAADVGLPGQVRTAAAALQASCAELVSAAQSSGREDAHGLSLYLPLQSLAVGMGPAGRAVHALYHDGLALSRATHWDEAMELLASGAQ